MELLSALKMLRKNPSASSINDVMMLPQFNQLQQQILQHDKGSDGEMTVAYLRDVSAMLSLYLLFENVISTDIMKAEREMISLAFAFDHQNYARYCSYQHVYLQDLKRKFHPAYQDLKSRGHGGSITGDFFSTIHGDLITELSTRKLLAHFVAVLARISRQQTAGCRQYTSTAC